MSHYEERLEKDLQRIQERIQAMAGLVERALGDSLRALLDRDVQLANMTVLRDNRINRASRELDRLCHAFIARHLPSAGHLRMMSAVIRLNVALERVGDYAVTISRESLQLSSPPQGKIALELERVSDASRNVLHHAIEAFLAGDAEAASAAIPISDNVENMMDDIYAELTSDESPRSPREVVAAFVVFSLLKRISDQGKNICEQTLFAVSGWRKTGKRFRVLFIDRGDNARSLMAQGIARKSHAEAGTYFAASPDPVGEPDAGLVDFLESCGIDTRRITVERLKPDQHELQEMDVIVSLDGPIADYIDEVPFHSSAIAWDIDGDLADAPADDYPTLYRALKNRVDDLVGLVSGSGESG